VADREQATYLRSFLPSPGGERDAVASKGHLSANSRGFRPARTVVTAPELAMSTQQRLQESIKAVQEVIPGLGDGFVAACLQASGMDATTAIGRILEDTLPAHVTRLDRGMPMPIDASTANPETVSKKLDKLLLTTRERRRGKTVAAAWVGKQRDTTSARMKAKKGAEEKKQREASDLTDRILSLYDAYDDEYDDTMDGMERISVERQTSIDANANHTSAKTATQALLQQAEAEEAAAYVLEGPKELERLQCELQDLIGQRGMTRGKLLGQKRQLERQIAMWKSRLAIASTSVARTAPAATPQPVKKSSGQARARGGQGRTSGATKTGKSTAPKNARRKGQQKSRIGNHSRKRNAAKKASRGMM